jgi:hypothetical protein
MMLTPDGRVITQFEFRQRLLELPGWEQYTALLTFFITENDDEAHPNAARLDAKIDHEVLATVTALCTLIAAWIKSLLSASHTRIGEIELRPLSSALVSRLTCPGPGVAETPIRAGSVAAAAPDRPRRTPDGDDAELDGHALIADRLVDEAGWLRQCSGWLTACTLGVPAGGEPAAGRRSP